MAALGEVTAGWSRQWSSGAVEKSGGGGMAMCGADSGVARGGGRHVHGGEEAGGRVGGVRGVWR